MTKKQLKKKRFSKFSKINEALLGLAREVPKLQAAEIIEARKKIRLLIEAKKVLHQERFQEEMSELNYTHSDDLVSGTVSGRLESIPSSRPVQQIWPSVGSHNHKALRRTIIDQSRILSNRPRYLRHRPNLARYDLCIAEKGFISHAPCVPLKNLIVQVAYVDGRFYWLGQEKKSSKWKPPFCYGCGRAVGHRAQIYLAKCTISKVMQREKLAYYSKILRAFLDKDEASSPPFDSL